MRALESLMEGLCVLIDFTLTAGAVVISCFIESMKAIKS